MAKPTNTRGGNTSRSNTQQPQRQQPNKATQAAEHQRRAAPATQQPTRQQNERAFQSNQTQRNVPARVETRQVAPRDGGEQLPDFMRDDMNVGKENIGREDLETPRLKLMQGLSPELQAYDFLRAGYFFHSAAEHVFEGPFDAVPIYMDKQYILWRPRDSGGGILARAQDGVHWSPANTDFEVVLDKKDGGGKVTWRTANTVEESGLALWGTMDPNDPNSPPAATQMYNFVLAFPDFPDLMPAVFTFQRSSVKSARKFMTKLKIAQGPIFARRYTFTPVLDKNNRGQDFYNISVSGNGIVEDAAEYAHYRELYQSFSSKGLSIRDIEGLQDEDQTTEEPEDNDNTGRGPRY